MTDNDTNLDLTTAERMLIEAGAPSQAAALKFYTEGIRNMMLGVVAPNFERALDTILTKHIDALSRRMDNADRARAERNAEFQEQLDNRLDAFGSKQDAIVTTLEAVVVSTGKQSQDISALKSGQDELRQGRAQNAARIERLEQALIRFSAWIDLADDAIVALDNAQQIIYVNQEALTLFGYTTAELIGRPLDILIPEQSRAQHSRHIDAFVHGDTATRRMAERQIVHARRKDGALVRIKASISRHADGYTAVVRRANGE